MKILWHSNAPWVPSGYGVQTALFAPRLAQMGHDVACSGFFGSHGANLVWNGLPVYPAGYQGYGNDVVHGHATQHFRGNFSEGLVISLMDTWVIDPSIARLLNWLAWTPVDHEEVPPAVAGVIREGEIIPLAMSKHGEHALRSEGLNPLYVPHGVDCSFYKPLDNYDDRPRVRRELGWPEDAFIVGMVAANRGWPSRKSYPQALEAFGKFAQGHPDVHLYLHTEINGVHQAPAIRPMLEEFGITPDKVSIIDQYMYACGSHPEYLRSAYQCMDVLLNPSMGEGFGIPILEAQACGTPVIVTNTTSMMELAHAGWAVDGTRFYTDQRGYQVIPNINSLVDALKQAYRMSSRMRGGARGFALNYNADDLMPTWENLLREVESRIGQVTTHE